MKLCPSKIRSRRSSAFSLTELLVAIGLLSVIVFALYAIFDQTQKALHANLQQSEMNESARPAMELMVRDLERAQAMGITNQNNFMTRYTKAPSAILKPEPGASFVSRLQSSLFYAQESEHVFRALGYFVGNEKDPTLDLGATNLVGTLYKYEDALLVTNRMSRAQQQAFDSVERYYPAANPAGHPWRGLHSSRLVEGVVHFRVTPSDLEGLDYEDLTYPRERLKGRTNEVILQGENLPYTTFRNTRVPAFVEIELGVLDSKTLETYRSIDNASAAQNFLNRNVGKVQIFRQRVPLRTALR